MVGDALEFGNSWKFSPSCPDAQAPRDACTANPYRKSWAQRQCSILNSATFAACHSQVGLGLPPSPGRRVWPGLGTELCLGFLGDPLTTALVRGLGGGPATPCLHGLQTYQAPRNIAGTPTAQ